MKIRCLTTAVVAVALALVLSAGAWAADPYEPNDSAAQAWGPVMANTNYTITKDTVNDEDWFVFYVPYHEQVTVTLLPGRTTNGELGGTDLWIDGNWAFGLEAGMAPRAYSITLEQGTHYLRFTYTNSPFPLTFNVTTNGTLVDQATLQAIITKQQNEQAALAARAHDESQITYYNGQVNYRKGQQGHYAGQVSYYTGQVKFWTKVVRSDQAEVKRDTNALRRAHCPSVIKLDKKRLSGAKARLAGAQTLLKRSNNALTAAHGGLSSATTNFASAQGQLGYWQGCWNTDNADVATYA